MLCWRIQEGWIDYGPDFSDQLKHIVMGIDVSESGEQGAGSIGGQVSTCVAAHATL